MICQSCRDNDHAVCRGDTWCDCQHRTDRSSNHWSDYPPPYPPSSDDLPAALPEVPAAHETDFGSS